MNNVIRVRVQEELSVINPNIHGHFIEHIGSCIYDGIWVGPDSAIPNMDGLRLDVVEALKQINPPVIRWPGGCFADQYHWRDGIGPRGERASQVTSRWGPDEVERNEFGTHEFMRFCQLLGAQPWLGGNVATSTPKELRDWAEYCNFPDGTTLSKERIANGASEPFDVLYWGIGNESWDCGGKFMPDTYADAYRHFESNFPNFYGKPSYLIACGPDGNKLEERKEWTSAFFGQLAKWRKPRLHGYDAHFYTWNSSAHAGTPTEFTVDEWYRLIAESMKVEEMILETRAMMDEYDPERNIDIIVGEWGTWHKGRREDPLLWQQNSMRDAIIAAVNLEIFHEHSDIVKMANLAQTVNILHSLILTKEEKMILTPTYYVFKLYQGHKGGRRVGLELSSPVVTFANGTTKDSLPALKGTASVKDGVLTLSVVNLHASDAIDAVIELPGETAGEWSAEQLSHERLNSHNTFEQPDTVVPKKVEAGFIHEGKLHFVFPAASVTVFTATLATV
ncbi:alpha-N-arabinofuranosidase [Paenibacillus sp. YIM B09110]|uniref:alpha-N-arabinofuranosidase n=1 Tax=Paenibacillus sp. YIM B09110 TaxID=3126102 RepID=UPI00301E5EE8